MGIAVVSKPPVPQEAFDRYPGRWIALRNGEIVADAATEVELREDARVESDDTLFRVPEASTHFYPARLS
jgi:Family of unknown function (DUF5678)